MMRIDFNGPNVARSAGTSKLGLGCLTLFLLPFCLVGLGTFLAGIYRLVGADPKQGMFLVLFGLVFGGVGFGMMFLAWRGYRQQQQTARLLAERPNEPWIARADWAAGRIKSSNQATMWGAWAIALFWNAVSWPVVFALSRELAKGNKLILIGLVFPLVGLGIIAAAILATLRYRRFGESWLELSCVPGAVNGYLAGVVRLNQPLLGAEPVEVRLVNCHRVVTGSGKHRQTSERILWEQTHLIDKTTDIPVFFRIPEQTQPTNSDNPRSSHLWRVELKARMPGVDYQARFEVPVYRVASQPPVPGFVQDLDRYRVANSPLRTPPEATVRFTKYGRRGPEFYFPPGRSKAMALVATLLFVGLTIGIGLLWDSKAPRGIAVFLGLFDLLVFVGMINAWFSSTRLTVQPGQLSLERGFLGLKRVQDFGQDQIAGFKVTRGGQVGQKIYYDIRLERADGRNVTLATMIGSQREADWIVERLRDCLSIREERTHSTTRPIP